MFISLVIINEPFGAMLLGKNSTLAYILSCAELGHQIYIYNLPQTGEIFPQEKEKLLTAFRLEKEDSLHLAKEFRKFNSQIKKLRDLEKYSALQDLENVTVTEILRTDLSAKSELSFEKVDFILQRFEPMKAPFPPEGTAKTILALQKIKAIFPRHIFNCPIFKNSDGIFDELQDKETPQEINRLIKSEIATPTAEFRLQNLDLLKAIDLMSAKYGEIFSHKNEAKLVIKPKNSAQSLGVFALQFSEKGLTLKMLKSKKVSELANAQIYKIQKDQLAEIIEILCYIQRVKNIPNLVDQVVGEISREKIIQQASELYNAEVLVQPFLEGVNEGDIRANFLKDSSENFYCAGFTFRSSVREEISDDFTTCYTGGGSTSKPISTLPEVERNALLRQCQIVLEVLNGELRQKYQNSIELGADFLLVGDGKSVMLGEINHFCPALIPVSEAMIEGENGYDEGLGFTKKAVRDAVGIQGDLSPKNPS